MDKQKKTKKILTLAERAAAFAKYRQRLKSVKQKFKEEGWEIMDQKRINPQLTKESTTTDPYIIFASRERLNLVDIFLMFVSDDLVQKMIESCGEIKFSNQKHLHITQKKVYQLLAILIYVYGQNGKGENEKNPQQKAFNHALSHFRDLFGFVNVLGENSIQLLYTHLLFKPDHEILLSANFCSFVASLGEMVVGDEKLFFFSGKSAFTRRVDSKPDKVGFWHYELMGKLDNDLPFLLQIKTHHTLASAGETTHVSDITKSWANLIVSKLSFDTVLVVDAYYLDQASRELFHSLGVKFLCGLSKHRFARWVDFLETEIHRPGDWIATYNEKENELLIGAFDMNVQLGKRYCLSNAFNLKKDKPHVGRVPAYDEYKVGFSLCDNFNQLLHNHTWPYRHGGFTSRGEFGSISDFVLSCVLLNTFHSYISIHKISKNNFVFQDFCETLSYDLFAYSLTLK